MDHVIGVDIGTQSTKALLTDANGRIVASRSQGYHPDTPRPRWAEQWPDVWRMRSRRALPSAPRTRRRFSASGSSRPKGPSSSYAS